MERTRFYINGYAYNLGEILSFEVTKHDFDYLYNIESSTFEGEHVIVSLESTKADLKETILVKSISTKPLQNETYMFKDTMFKLTNIRKGDPTILIPNFNFKEQNNEEERVMHARQQEWERLQIETDAVKRIRETLHGHDVSSVMTKVGVYNYKTSYNLDNNIDASIEYNTEYLSTSFGVSKYRKIDTKYHDLLKTWNAYESFQFFVRHLQQEVLEPYGLVLQAAYGLDDKILNIRIGRKHEQGFKFINVKYTDRNNTNIYVCEPRSDTERMLIDKVLKDLNDVVNLKLELTIEQALERFK